MFQDADDPPSSSFGATTSSETHERNSRESTCQVMSLSRFLLFHIHSTNLTPGDSVSIAPLSSMEAMRPVTACPAASCAGAVAAATTDGRALTTANPSMGRAPMTFTAACCPALNTCVVGTSRHEGLWKRRAHHVAVKLALVELPSMRGCGSRLWHTVRP